MDALGMKLTCLVGLDEILRIKQGGRPVKTLPERFSSQGSRGNVTRAHAFMYVRQQCLSFFLGYAAELDPAFTPAIEVPIYQHIHFGLPGDALSLLVVLG